MAIGRKSATVNSHSQAKEITAKSSEKVADLEHPNFLITENQVLISMR
jgi:hypothetical protein